MNVTVEELAPCKKLVRIEVEAQKVDEAFEEIAKDFQREARLPGFRPGKAPKDMVLKRYEADILTEVKKQVMSDAYRKALTDNKLNVIGSPDIEEIQFGRGQAMQFAATIETAPEFELPDYKGIPVKRETATVTPADIERGIEALRQRQVTFDTVQRELQQGDVAVINYTGTCEGKPITDLAPAAKGITEKKNFWVAIAPDSFIPGFADQLTGAKAGDKRTVTVNFSADFVTPEIAGKQGVYDVEVVEVKERKLPEIDDAFAKTYEAANLDTLREGIRADLQNELNAKQTRSLRDQAASSLMEKIKCDLPESLVEQETRRIIYNIVHDNQQRGLTKEVLDSQKDMIYAKASETARERVKATFVFQKVAEKEGVRVSDPEMSAKIGEWAARNNMAAEKLAATLQKNGGLDDVYFAILTDKVIDLLVQNARIEDVPAPSSTAS